MKIINLSFYKISTTKIKKAILLLPKQYRDIDIPIYVVPNVFVAKILFGLFLKDNQDNIKSFTTSDGFCNVVGNKIERVILKFPDGNCKNIRLMISIYHELRHVYQSLFLKDIFAKDLRDYKDNLSCGYDKQLIEIDANRFTANFIRSNKDKLTNIFNISFNRIKFDHNTNQITVKRYREH